MENLNFTEVLKELVNNFNSSSKRIRYSLFLIIIASFLTYSGFLNSRQNSWQKSRLETLQKDIMTIKLLKDAKDLKYLKIFGLKNFSESEQNKIIYWKETNDSISYNLYLSYLESKYYQLAKLYCERTLYFTVPIFGVYFDINDLSLLSGAILIILSFFLFFSLDREFQNIKILMTVSRKELDINNGKKIYFIIASNQIINFPKMEVLISTYPKTTKLMKMVQILPLFLFILPLFSYLCVFINDCCTFTVGASTNVRSTLMSLIGGGIMMAFIIFFVIINITMYFKTLKILVDFHWRLLHEKDWPMPDENELKSDSE